MLHTQVIKATSQKKLQDDLNAALEFIDEKNFIDLKLTGANDGKSEIFVAVIIYRR